ncbi:MAG: ferredoxin [Verrucomicrobiales bacterium]|nr:ferredoxin [Verrucomicrobiales bacterium]
MAELHLRLKSNVPGKYYIDSTCIDCDMCRTSSPDVFRRDEELGQTAVFRQPVTSEECRAAEEDRIGCPSDSIGNDGEE